ncbi:MAG: flagellar protein [Firmicutes bacterium]|nr:flagellar protein [Bacillota bacterium]
MMIPPIVPTPAATQKAAVPKPSSAANASDFQGILKDKLNQGIKFSQHAEQRLRSRNISLSGSDLQRLNTAVDKAANKGARDSLVLMDNLALVVSVKNRTVITAVDESSLKENVFTNIDSAIIV